MPTLPKPKGHVGDGFMLTGPKLRFTGFKEQEMRLEGVMFYGSSRATASAVDAAAVSSAARGSART